MTCQVPQSMGFPRQEYWSGLPFPSPGDLPDPGIALVSPALAGRFFTTEPQGNPWSLHQTVFWNHPLCLCPLLTLLSMQSRFYNLWVQCKMQGPSWEWGISLPSYGPPPTQPTGRWADPKREQPRRSWVSALRVSEGPLLSRPAMCHGHDGHCLVLSGEATGPALNLELDLVSAGEWRAI